MGKLFYGSDPQPVEMDDRLLQYVQTLVATKLRRSESFTLTWTDRDSTAGRTTLWIQPAIPMRFRYTTDTPARLSGAYLRQLADQAALSAGLVIDAATWEQQESARQQPQLVAA